MCSAKTAWKSTASLATHWVHRGDSDQTGQMSRDSDQIRPVWSFFAVRMKKRWVFSYPLSAQRRPLTRLGRCPGWSESLLGSQSVWWFCHAVAQMLKYPTNSLVPAWEVNLSPTCVVVVVSLLSFSVPLLLSSRHSTPLPEPYCPVLHCYGVTQPTLYKTKQAVKI